MTQEWLTVIVSWLPLLVFVGIAIWYARSAGMRARGPSGASLIELYELQVNESRRMNANLERIAASLEKRAQG